MEFNFPKESQEHKNTLEDLKTAAEHEAMILRYKQTGYLDQNDAIQKYRAFNDDHPDYYFPMQAAATSAGTAVRITNVSEAVIVENLNQQLRYLTGKNLLGELQKQLETY